MGAARLHLLHPMRRNSLFFPVLREGLQLQLPFRNPLKWQQKGEDACQRKGAY